MSKPDDKELPVETLLPCPFCGGLARIREDGRGGIVGCLPEDNRRPETVCHGVFSVYVGFGARRSKKPGQHRYNKADAIKAWNHRPSGKRRGS